MNEMISLIWHHSEDIVRVQTLDQIRIQFGDKESEPLADFIHDMLDRIKALEQQTESLRFANKVRDARY